MWNKIKKWNWDMGLCVAAICVLGTAANQSFTIPQGLVIGSCLSVFCAPLTALFFK